MSLTPPAGVSISGDALFTATANPATPIVLLGIAGKSRLEVAGVQAGLGLRFLADGAGVKAEPALEGSLTGGHLVIDPGDGDGLLKSLLGEGTLEAGFETVFGWSPSTGLVFRGGLEIAFPIDVTIGPVVLTQVHLAITFADKPPSRSRSARAPSSDRSPWSSIASGRWST